MTIYTKIGSQLHKDINKFLKWKKSSENDKPPNINHEITNVLDDIINQQNWKIIETEMKIKNKVQRLNGTIDALFKQNNRYIVVDWKYTNNLPTKRELEYYTNFNINPLTPFYDNKIAKYILQLNLYKFLLITSSLNSPPSVSDNEPKQKYTWDNVDLCLVFINRNWKMMDTQLYYCKQFNELDVRSLLDSYFYQHKF